MKIFVFFQVLFHTCNLKLILYLAFLPVIDFFISLFLIILYFYLFVKMFFFRIIKFFSFSRPIPCPYSYSFLASTEDPFSYFTPILLSFFRNLSPSNSILAHSLLCASPPRCISGVCLKIICTYTCPPATRSLLETRDYRWPSLSAKEAISLLLHRFFRGRNCEILKQVFISAGIYIKISLRMSFI